jgi:hypothetical protein
MATVSTYFFASCRGAKGADSVRKSPKWYHELGQKKALNKVILSKG